MRAPTLSTAMHQDELRRKGSPIPRLTIHLSKRHTIPASLNVAAVRAIDNAEQ